MGILLFCLVSCACASGLVSCFVILLKAHHGVWSDKSLRCIWSWADSCVHLAWSGCFLFLSAFLFVSLTVCLWLFLEISCIESEGHWTIYYLLFTVLEPCGGAVQGPSSLALWLGLSLLVDCSWVFSCPCYELEKTSVDYFSSLRLFRS